MKKNNGVFYVVISLVAVLAIGGAVAAYSAAQNINVNGNYNYYEAEGQTVPAGDINFGAASGTDFYQPINAHAGFTLGALATSTAATTQTLTENDLQNYGFWAVTPTVGSLTYTLPATTTLSTLMKNAGDSYSWKFQMATTSTGITLTLAKGTGWNLVGVDANTDVIPGAAWGSQEILTVDCVRQVDTDIACFLDEAIAAD